MTTESLARPSVLWAWLGLAALAPRVGSAEAPLAGDGTAKAPGRVLSAYEQETIREALDELGAEIDPAPEGKAIEEILIRPLDVLEPRDPVPEPLRDLLNVFHVTTKPRIVRREVLQSEGQRYQQVVIDETERNLRILRPLSLVLSVPLKGSRPDRVRLLIITKDIWSLRLNSDLRVSGAGLEYLLISPSEENLLGVHQSLSTRFTLDPAVLSFGASYRWPRVDTSRVDGRAGFEIYVNRETGAAEGSAGELAWGQPLFTTRTPWAWQGVISWSSRIARRFVGVEVDTYDARATDTDDAIPIAFEADNIASRFAITRSFGWLSKLDVAFGLEAMRLAYRPLFVEGVDPRAAEEFERVMLPVSDTRIAPFVTLSAYTNHFTQQVDVNSLALQENYRLGHDLYLKAAPTTEALGSTRTFMGLYAGAAYTAAPGDALFRAFSEATLEAEADRIADASIGAGLRVVTPSLGLGRLHFEGVGIDRFRNYMNRRSTIGGDGRLRGYPSGAFFGERTLAGNLEFRTHALSLWTVQLGAVAFTDAGNAWDDGEPFLAKQSVGGGLRLVFPQLDRTVLRFDWGFPLVPVPELGVTGPFPGAFVLTFRQAFGMPVIAPPAAVL